MKKFDEVTLKVDAYNAIFQTGVLDNMQNGVGERGRHSDAAIDAQKQKVRKAFDELIEKLEGIRNSI